VGIVFIVVSISMYSLMAILYKCVCKSISESREDVYI
jgi:hypothetical protein